MKKTTLILIALLAINSYSGEKKLFIPEVNIDTSDLKSHVEFLVNTTEPRSWENTEVLNHVSAYINEKFIESGLESNFQEFNAFANQYRNVIGVINGHLKRIIVIGAHYDVYGDLPGADDNATGVAGLIELAKVLKEYESNIKFQIQFVAYANEEPPFFGGESMGSFIHAKSLHVKKAHLVYM